MDGISNSIAKLPLYIMDETTKERKPEHPLTPLLTLRPNELMTAQTYKKLLETERLLTGNGYAWIHRDPLTCEPVKRSITGAVRDPLAGYQRQSMVYGAASKHRKAVQVISGRYAAL